MRAGRVVGLFAPAIALGSAVACSSDFDTSRTLPPRGTLGEELYGVVCDRLGGQSLHEDLTGASFRDICHRRTDGTFSDHVDQSVLPALVDGRPDTSGKPVPLGQQQADRAYGVARLETLARHRLDLIAALDATFPDERIPVKDVGNPDPAQSCNPPAASGEGSLHTELTNLLGRFQALYDDGTIPQSTEAIGRIVNAFKAAPDAQRAWAVYDARAGYRPIDVNLGAARPMIAYAGLRDFANAALSLISYDSQPYGSNPTPVAGAAYAQLSSLLSAAHAELANATADPPDAPLAATTDPVTGRAVLSRPRTDLEVLQTLLYAQDPAFGGGASRFIVQRDPRGYAAVPRAGGKLPAPFVDADGNGLPDVDANGAFVTSDGSIAPSPFFAVGAPDAPARDDFGRALLAPGGGLTYGTIDTSHTYAASLARNLEPLLDANPQDAQETVMNLLSGAEVVLGARAPMASKSYTDGEKVTCTAFDTTRSPMLDLLFAFANVLADPTTDDTLAFVESLVRQQPNTVARVVGDGLYAKSLANVDLSGRLPQSSTLWDEMIDVAIQIEQEPGLLEDVLRALGDDASLPLASSFSAYMRDLDHVSYDRGNLNGPAFDETTNDGSEPRTPADRTEPDTGANRSEMQRFLQAIHDTNAVTACNKPGAVVHAQGIPLVGSADICGTNGGDSGTLCSLGGRPFTECEVFKIDDLAAFYLDSIVGAANLYFRPSILRNGIVGVGAANVGMIEQSSGIGHDPNNADTYNGPDPTTPGFWDTSGSQTFRPKPGWLDRLVFFDLAKDSPTPSGPNYTTNHFLADLQGTLIGASVCPERVIPDPCNNDSSCGGNQAAGVSADGNVHGLRSCPAGDWLFDRDQDATFVWEDFGFTRAVTPLVSAFAVAKNPMTGQPRHREDLFIALMEALHKHWQTQQGAQANPGECTPTLSPATSCTQDGADTYEPLLSQIFSSDMLSALHDLVKVAEGITVPTCAAVGPTGACTQAGPPVDGVAILADATRALIDPKRAAAAKLTDRQGHVTSARNDGSTNPQVTPIYLVLEALDEIDRAFASWAQANPNDPRQAQWRSARSQLVDQLLGVSGQNTPAQSFVDPSFPKALPVLLDLVRAQVAAHCPGPPYGSCTWARQTLTKNAAATIGGPTFAATIDLLEALRKNAAAREELEKLLTYLVDAGSDNDALAELMASADDLVQVMRDDANLVPLYHVLAAAAAPTSTGADGKVQRGFVDATMALLTRIAGRAYEGKTEICAGELDPDGVLPLALAHLVTPMPRTSDPPGGAAPEGGASGPPGETPLEVILDAIGDVNRAAPGASGPMQGTDLANAANELSEFFLDPQRGLEQFYAIVKNGNAGEGPRDNNGTVH